MRVSSILILLSVFGCSQDYDFNGLYEDADMGAANEPDIAINPARLDFGSVSEGDTEVRAFSIQNRGDTPLGLEELSMSQGVPFSILTSVPVELQVDETVDVEVSFSPMTAEQFTGFVTVYSDDPDEPSLAVELMGSLISEEIEIPQDTAVPASGPVAVCAAEPNAVVPITEPLAWVGHDSWDPDGNAIVDYSWTLVGKPTGSAVNMPGGSTSTPDRAPFFTDLAGVYTAQLVVTNDAGAVSEPCIAEAEAIPSEDLWIEMYWTHNNDDMDLHLLKPGGSLDTNSDCYWANCVFGGLDWGVNGSPSDNPSLDLDDIPDTGPENINIASPQSGVFTVYVHDYPTSSFNGANDVTVNIYLGGALVWTDMRTISGENSYEPFAEIDWPSGTITSL